MAKKYRVGIIGTGGISRAHSRGYVACEHTEIVAAAVEFLLEGLHINKRLNKSRSGGKTVYRQ